ARGVPLMSHSIRSVLDVHLKNSGNISPSRGADAPGFFLPPVGPPHGAGAFSFPSAQGRGRGAPRGATFKISRLATRAPRSKGARPAALRLRLFSIPGRAFQGAAPGGDFCPDQPAPGGGTVVSPRRSPGPPECEVTSLARGNRAPLRLWLVSGDALG